MERVNELRQSKRQQDTVSNTKRKDVGCSRGGGGVKGKESARRARETKYAEKEGMVTFRDKGGGRERGGKGGKGWPSERYSWQRRRCNNCPHPSSTRDRLEQREKRPTATPRKPRDASLIVASISLSLFRSLRAVKDGENNRNRRRSRLRDKRCYHPLHAALCRPTNFCRKMPSGLGIEDSLKNHMRPFQRSQNFSDTFFHQLNCTI